MGSSIFSGLARALSNGLADRGFVNRGLADRLTANPAGNRSNPAVSRTPGGSGRALGDLLRTGYGFSRGTPGRSAGGRAASRYGTGMTRGGMGTKPAMTRDIPIAATLGGPRGPLSDIQVPGYSTGFDNAGGPIRPGFNMPTYPTLPWGLGRTNQPALPGPGDVYTMGPNGARSFGMSAAPGMMGAAGGNIPLANLLSMYQGRFNSGY